jgi:thioredoxin
MHVKYAYASVYPKILAILNKKHFPLEILLFGKEIVSLQRFTNTNKKMKLVKINAIVLIAVFAFSCGNTKSTENKEDNSNKNIKSEKKMGTIHLTKADFLTKIANYETNPNEWKYLGDKPAIIDFYADWCGPCRMVAPVLEELAREYDGKIYIYKVDTEAEAELAALFGIRSIPSLLFIPMNAEPQMTRGAMSKPQFKEIIDNVLLK